MGLQIQRKTLKNLSDYLQTQNYINIHTLRKILYSNWFPLESWVFHRITYFTKAYIVHTISFCLNKWIWQYDQKVIKCLTKAVKIFLIEKYFDGALSDIIQGFNGKLYYIFHRFLETQMRAGIPIFTTVISKRGNYNAVWKKCPFSDSRIKVSATWTVTFRSILLAPISVYLNNFSCKLAIQRQLRAMFCHFFASGDNHKVCERVQQLLKIFYVPV